jgi:hypothetical protein
MKMTSMSRMPLTLTRRSISMTRSILVGYCFHHYGDHHQQSRPITILSLTLDDAAAGIVLGMNTALSPSLIKNIEELLWPWKNLGVLSRLCRFMRLACVWVWWLWEVVH